MTGGALSGGHSSPVSAPEIFWGLPEIGWVAVAALAAVAAVVVSILLYVVPKITKSVNERTQTQPTTKLNLDIKRIEAQWMRQTFFPGQVSNEFKIALFYANNSNQTIYITEIDILLGNKRKAFAHINATVVAGDEGVSYTIIKVPAYEEMTSGYTKVFFRGSSNTLELSVITLPIVARVNKAFGVLGPSFSYDLLFDISQQTLKP